MTIDPRTPVLVGVGAVSRRDADPTTAPEAAELMASAAQVAADDAGTTALLAALDRVAVPEGTWGYRDAGRLVADRLRATGATTVLAEVGVTQQELIAETCAHLAAGDLEVALVVGGETRHRAVTAKAAGVEVGEAVQGEEVSPDRRLSPDTLGIADIEIVRNAVTPTTAYALIEHARMVRLGRSPEAHAAALGELWVGFAEVAGSNPWAWDWSPRTATGIATPSAANRLIATPYTKAMCSQWNVDQAAALLLCSVEAAVSFGIDSSRWLFPLASTVCNHAVPVVQRPDLSVAPGADVAAQRVLALAGVGVDQLDEVDLYSCFPAAVQAHAEALGLSLDRPLTVTGGMSFAGGPLNNYVLGAMVELAHRLRSEPGSVGLSSSVSGFLTKQGFGVWSTTPPEAGFRSEDVTEAAAAAPGAAPVPLDPEHVGAATIVSWTVEHVPTDAHPHGEPHRAVVVCETLDGARTLASTGDPSTIAEMAAGAHAGRSVDVRPDGSFLLT